MQQYDTVIRQIHIANGSGHDPEATLFDVAITDGRITAITTSDSTAWLGNEEIAGEGRVLAPGFIDVHTCDDINVIRTPDMLYKVSQGITTMIVGNCGISALPATLKGDLPDPMNLLGPTSTFTYPTPASYIKAVEHAQLTVNAAALVGHMALCNNHLDRLDCPATAGEVEGMRVQLCEALAHGVLGLSTGLVYANAFASTTEEMMGLAEPLAKAGAIYMAYLRTEFTVILDAVDEAHCVGKHACVPVVISYLKCVGVASWGCAGEVLESIEGAQRYQPVGCDCYPYTVSLSTLDLKQVTNEFDTFTTWSKSEAGTAEQTLKEIAAVWGIGLIDAARRLQSVGAVYHNMSAQDLDRIVTYPATVIGSDGLSNDPKPHPRLWGTFPRALGYYSRKRKLLSLVAAVWKMIGQFAERFGLTERGLMRGGYWADLVLLDPETVRDVATFIDSQQPATGTVVVWANGHLSYQDGAMQPHRAGRFLKRGPRAHATVIAETH